MNRLRHLASEFPLKNTTPLMIFAPFPWKHTACAVLCGLAVLTASTPSWAEPDNTTATPAATATQSILSGSLMGSGLVLTKATELRDQVANTASDLVMTALGFLGVPYRRGGEDADVGFDCSGFVRSTFEKTIGLVLPRRAEEQAKATTSIPKEELRPGDLVFFNTMRRAFSHVGIYLGDGKFIHAPRPGHTVRVEDMRIAYWKKRFNGARRVSAEGDGSAAPSRQ